MLKLLKCLNVKVLAVSCFLISGYFVLKYISFYSFAEMNSDTMDSLLWSLATYESGGLLSSDFYYPCLLGAGGNVILLPFISLFGYSAMAYKWGMAFFFVLFISSCYFFFYAIDLSFEKRFVFCTAICTVSLSSSVLRKFMWTHILYYNLGILLFLLGFSCMCMYLKKYQKKWLIGFGIVLAVSAMNGFTEILLVALPLLLICIIMLFLDFDTPLFTKDKAQIYYMISIGMIGLILGKGIMSILYGDITTMGYDESFTCLSGVETWMEHVHILIPSWLDLFGVSATEKCKFFSFEGIHKAVSLVVGVAVAIVPVIYTIFYNKVNDVRKRIIWGHWIITGIILFGFICGQLYRFNWRLIPCVFTAFIITLLCFYDFARQIRVKNLSYIIYTVFSVLVLVSMFGLKRNFDNINWQQKVAEYLDEQGYEYGYAPYFAADTIMLFSNQTRIISLWEIGAFPENNWGIHRYNTFVSWIDQAASQGGGSFIIVNQSEYENMNDLRREVVDKADNVVILGNYYIFEFYDGLILN